MSFIQRLFKKKDNQTKQLETERYEVMGGSPAYFTPHNRNAYELDTFRSAVDTIARNSGKLKASHKVKSGDQKKDGDERLNNILQVRPNEYMSSYDMIYKLVTHYYIYNNAFAYLDKDNRGSLKAIYPLRPQQVEFVTDPTDTLYCKFVLGEGKTITLPYSDILHIRRFYNDNDLLGDDNSAIQPTLDLAHTQSEGMTQSIKAGATIRGILKYNQVVSPEKLKQEKDMFIKDYLSVANNGGIVAVDQKSEYIPLETKPVDINEGQLKSIKTKIYDYLGVSEAIVSGNYNEDEWSAFYESIIEPLALQFSLELTEKIFTKREKQYGNSIILETNRLQFSSNETKTKMIKELLPMGLISINEAREILNIPGVEDGDRYLQSLNYVDTSIVKEYQLKSRLDGGEKVSEFEKNKQ